MFCRGIKGEFDFSSVRFQKTVLICPVLSYLLVAQTILLQALGFTQPSFHGYFKK